MALYSLIVLMCLPLGIYSVTHWGEKCCFQAAAAAGADRSVWVAAWHDGHVWRCSTDWRRRW